MDKIYFQLGDGFEFILPMSLPIRGCATLPFMANAIYDFATNEWKKYGITVYDADCVQYQWRSADLESRRKNFDDLPILDLEALRERGYLLQRSGSSAYLMNKDSYSKRRTAFVEKVKALPTTINLGVDEELKALMQEVEAREREQEVGVSEVPYLPSRKEGITYVQLGDGFEFIIDRAYETLPQMMKLSSTILYDMVEKKWAKYRTTLYKVGEEWHCKIIVKEEDRKLDLTHVQRLTYHDLIALGYVFDSGEGVTARYRFDYVFYKNHRRAMNIVFDDVVAREREVGN